MKATIGAVSTALCILATPAMAQFSDNAVKIAILNDMGGIYADTGGKGSIVAAQLAAEDFGNKIGGIPIEIISGDHQNKPDSASNIARQTYDTRWSRCDRGRRVLRCGARHARTCRVIRKRSFLIQGRDR